MSNELLLLKSYQVGFLFPASAKRWASLWTTGTSAARPRGKRKPYHKKRKYEPGQPAANTNIGPHRTHTVRVQGGNKKYSALRLDVGNISWSSECCARKTRIIDAVYNASNSELVCTKTGEELHCTH
ncbi:40S ribosomal protein S8-like protein [Cricetulus griseus]|nr:40S ribosomal protein S8-like protein [Cricetulus griseus]